MTDTSCEDVRRKFVEGRAGEALGELLKHVESCERCREWLRGAMTKVDGAADDAAPRPPDLDEPRVDDSKSSERRRAARGHARARRGPAFFASALAVAFLGWLLAGPHGRTPPQEQGLRSVKSWSGALDAASSTEESGVAAEVCRGGVCSVVSVGERVEPGDTVRTGAAGQARLRLDDGTLVSLERATSLVLDSEQDLARIERGVILVEASTKRRAPLVLGLPRGRSSLALGSLVARVLGPTTTVEVLRGRAEVDGLEVPGRSVRAGQVVTWLGDGRPKVTLASVTSSSLVLASTDDSTPGARGLGELRAKRPGSDEERAGAVSLRRHAVKARVVEGFARIEIDETFQNDSDEILEGIYRFPLPPDAQIERLALEVDGRLEDGAFVDRDRAAAIWRGAIVNAGGRVTPREEIVWVPGPWKDPALLEWQRGGRFELRIFPIPRRGARRVVLAYTLALPSVAGVRRLSVPLPRSARRDLRLDELSVDLEVRGHDPALGLNVHGYDVVREPRGDVDALRLVRHGFVPAGDLSVEFGTGARDQALNAWGYELSVDGDDRGRAAPPLGSKPEPSEDLQGRYVALTLRPEWPLALDDAPRALAIVVDSSRSMLGENHRRAIELAARLVGELDVRDQFTVLACDVTCRSLGAPRHPDSTSDAALREFLRASPPSGASDLAASVVEGARAVAGAAGFAGTVVFLGDGAPTIGPLRSATLVAAVRDGVPAGVTVHAVAVGAEADRESLDAVSRAGRGVVVGYEPGRTVDEVAVAVLAAASGSRLTDAKLELPEGLFDVAPRELGTIAAGGEITVGARMSRSTVSGTVRLTGVVFGEPFAQSFSVEVEARGDAGNAFVPRVFAARRIRDLERDGSAAARAQAVALSSRFAVASRYTSLLVLESPAMSRAFGLDLRRAMPDWTGEDDAVSSIAEGEGPEASREDEAAPESSMVGEAADGIVGGSASGAVAAKPKRANDAPLSSAPASAPARDAAEASSARDKKAETSAEFAEPPGSERASSRLGSGRRPPSEMAYGPSPREFLPMKVVWERDVSFVTGPATGQDAAQAIALEAELARAPNRREIVKKLMASHVRGGNLERAGVLVERWLDKEPLDEEALLARAELFAARGDREGSMRERGSIIDSRPHDVERILGLARALRLAGDVALACRHVITAAELRRRDASVLGEAVQCAREAGLSRLGSALLEGADEAVRRQAGEATRPKEEPAIGELRLDATWSGDGELDVVLVDPKGRGISWLDAPGKVLVRAKDAISPDRETLAVSGAKGGDYGLWVRRARGRGALRGEVVIVGPNGFSRRIPFRLDGEQSRLGALQLRWHRRLVPVGAWQAQPSR